MSGSANLFTVLARRRRGDGTLPADFSQALVQHVRSVLLLDNLIAVSWILVNSLSIGEGRGKCPTPIRETLQRCLNVRRCWGFRPKKLYCMGNDLGIRPTYSWVGRGCGSSRHIPVHVHSR
jgi:hypothetical protein